MAGKETREMEFIFNAKLNIQQMNGALQSFQNNLKGLKLPDSLFKSTTKDIEKLQGHLKDFEVLTSKTSFDNTEANQVLKLYKQIDNEIKALGIDSKAIGNIDLQKLMPTDVLQRFQKLGQLLEEIQGQIDFKSNIPDQLKDLGDQAAEAEKKVQSLKNEIDQLNRNKNKINNDLASNQTEQQRVQNEIELLEKQQKAFVNSRAKNPETIKKNEQELKKLNTEVDRLQSRINTLRQQIPASKGVIQRAEREGKLEQAQIDLKATKEEINRLQSEQRSLKAQKEPTSTKIYQDRQKEIEKLRQELNKLKQDEKELTNNQKGNSKDITAKTKEYEAQMRVVDEINKKIENLNTAEADTSKIQEIRQALADLLGVDISQIPEDLEKLKENASNIRTDNIEQIRNALKALGIDVENLGKAYAEAKEEEKNFKQEQEKIIQENKDVAAFKSRIEYLLGLNNAINLVKRGIRSAFNTIKELDKAMTETAVVTDMTVSDMWNKLPEYTKRANELGVSTLQAYQAATLYYQQGLNDTQAAELSTETLKMARIAGLEAAEATDRMTNALRGFNMELNAVNAQKVDDVYSKLAAMSASNVDEISTAMTKVASLAHNANMDFETTAAFLAQIIETTRESAETAGTALKTVVARFSEVKKLVDENQLKGADEEGQVIDVNKVSQALRTAGIDLNKYFLGEVGLDDIFMELASKWDSLTSVQQRYIATQAAGSRQQSRFIAMMQDYARTQELVGAAYNANGASAQQFEKTQDSLQSKLERLKNAWNEFLMGITNSTLVKAVVDLLTLLLNVVNKLTSAFGLLDNKVGSFVSGFLKLSAALLAFKGLKTFFGAGGAASKLFSGFSKSGIGQFFGFGGASQPTTQAGVGFKSQVVEAGELFKGAVLEAAGVEKTVGSNSSNMPTRLTFREWADNFKKNNPNTKRTLHISDKGTYDDDDPNVYKTVNVGTPKTLFGALGNKFKDNTKLGGSISKGLGKIGKLFGGTGAAAGGAATLAATLGVATIAAVALGFAIKKAYDASPAGQLKIAKKYAESLKKVSENAKKVASEMKEAKTKTEDYEKQISEATSPNERRKLIQEQNEYITSLMEQDKRYAKYVTTTYTNGQLHLTINSDDLDKAIEEATITATKTSALTNLANADVLDKQALVLVQQAAKALDKEYQGNIGVENIDFENRTITYTAEGSGWTGKLSEEDFAKVATYYSQISGAQEQARGYRTAAISQFGSLYSSQVNGEVLTLISDIFTEYFDWDKISKKAEEQEKNLKFTSSAAREAEYYRLFGTELEAGYDKSTVDKSIAYAQVLEEELNKQFPDFINIAKDLNGQTVLQILSGTYTGTQEAAQEAIAQISKDSTYAKAFASLLHVQEDQLEAELTKEYNQLMASYDQLRRTLIQKLTKAGAGTYASIYTAVQKLDINKIKQLSKYTDKFTSNYGKQFSGKILADITAAMYNGTWDGSYLQSFVDSNLSDNLVLTYGNLTKWAGIDLEQANEYEKAMNELANTYLELANVDSTFSQRNLVQWFLMSDEYDGLTESISKFIEENGQINSHNIEELANSNETLKALLDSNIISANGLANAINALAKGKIGVSDLTKEILELYEAVDTTANAIQRAGSYIKNFDAGEDYGDAIDFINSGIERMQELLNTGEIGNPQFQNYMKAFFGNLPDQDDIAGWQERIDLLKKITGGEGADFWTDILGFNREGNFIDMQTEEFAESDVNSYKDYIKTKVEDIYGEGFFTDEFYDLMLRNAANHDAGWAEEIAQIELDKIVNAYENTKPTKSDIEAIAAAYGIDPQELYEAWKTAHPDQVTEYELPESYTGLETQQRRTTTSIFDQEVLGTDYKVQNNLLGNKQGIVQALGMDEEGNFTLDQLYLKIGEIVPEVADGTMTPEEWLNEQLNGEEIEVPVTAKVTEYNEEEGVYETKEVEIKVKGSSAEELQQNYYAALEQESIKAANWDWDGTINSLIERAAQVASAYFDAVKGGVTQAFDEATGNLKIPAVHVPIIIDNSSGTLTIEGTSIPITIGPSLAKGGIVKSAANGYVEPGLALTGEEGSEIVWNKEKGYAYLAGKNGPEINNLQPGDQIFDATKTKQILKRSGISSFAKGTINSYSVFDEAGGGLTYWGNGSSGSGGGSSSKSSNEWKNELDWLYDLMEDIAEEEHKQTLIQSEYELAEKDLSKTGRDLFNLTKSELETLNTQLEAQQFAFEKRLQQMNELQQKVVAEGFEEYLRWNTEDNSLEIDWDKINEITDKDTYDKLSELVSDMEKVQDQMDEAQEATLDIKKQIQELQTRYLQAYLDFQDRVMEAVVAQYQQNIDDFSTLNDTINEASQSILDSIQKEIDLQRQIRDNTDTEKEIADLEAQLAFLQRDTTGASQQQILELQKQLDEARKNYSDTLVDQAIDRLSQNNDDASSQREKQIELLQAQLEYWQETGALWQEVAELIASGFTPQGSIIQGSELWEFLKKKDSWQGLSQAQKDNWANELILQGAQVGAYLIQLNDGDDANADRIIASIAGQGEGLAAAIGVETKTVFAMLNEVIAQLGGTPLDSIPGEGGYASGGLATKTGYAMLHGTANEPEYVLNARQTDAFLRLADVLPAMFEGSNGVATNIGGNVYVDLTMNVGEIGSDYDVDRMVARVKEDIYSAATYRNVNAVGFLR